MMEKLDILYKGGIHPDLRKKALLRCLLSEFSILFIYFIFSMSIYFASTFVFMEILALVYIIIGLISIGLLLIIGLILSYFWYGAYIDKYSFIVYDTHIIINRGVLTQTKTTILYSKVQKINMNSGILDRKYGLYNIVLETVGCNGFSNNMKGNIHGPEGFIPGQKDPSDFVEMIKSRLTQFSEQN